MAAQTMRRPCLNYSRYDGHGRHVELFAKCANCHRNSGLVNPSDAHVHIVLKNKEGAFEEMVFFYHMNVCYFYNHQCHQPFLLRYFKKKLKARAA